MDDQNGFFVLAQITIGAYVCYFEYIMWLLMMTKSDATTTRKNRRSAMRNNITVIMNALEKVADYAQRLLR